LQNVFGARKLTKEFLVKISKKIALIFFLKPIEGLKLRTGVDRAKRSPDRTVPNIIAEQTSTNEKVKVLAISSPVNQQKGCAYTPVEST